MSQIKDWAIVHSFEKCCIFSLVPLRSTLVNRIEFLKLVTDSPIFDLTGLWLFHIDSFEERQIFIARINSYFLMFTNYYSAGCLIFSTMHQLIAACTSQRNIDIAFHTHNTKTQKL